MDELEETTHINTFGEEPNRVYEIVTYDIYGEYLDTITVDEEDAKYLAEYLLLQFPELLEGNL